jgi:hypothetical protein
MVFSDGTLAMAVRAIGSQSISEMAGSMFEFSE